jgi:hypothetical protein
MSGVGHKRISPHVPRHVRITPESGYSLRQYEHPLGQLGGIRAIGTVSRENVAEL